MFFRLYLQVLTKTWLVSKFGHLAGGFLIDFPSMGLMYLAILGIFVEVNKYDGATCVHCISHF